MARVSSEDARQRRRDRLKAIVARASAPQQLVLRARIVLAAWRGEANAKIARELGVCVDTVRMWRGRLRREPMPGLFDRPRSDRPPVYGIEDQLLIVATVTRDERKGVWIDEAFFLSEVPIGRVLMNRFARDSRKWNVRVLLSSQVPADFLKIQGFVSLLDSVFIGRLDDDAQADALRMLKVPTGVGYEQAIASLRRRPGAAHTGTTRDTSPRQFVFTDGAGGVERIRVDFSGPTWPGCAPPWTPPPGRDRRRPAHRRPQHRPAVRGTRQQAPPQCRGPRRGPRRPARRRPQPGRSRPMMQRRCSRTARRMLLLVALLLRVGVAVGPSASAQIPGFDTDCKQASEPEYPGDGFVGQLDTAPPSQTIPGSVYDEV